MYRGTTRISDIENPFTTQQSEGLLAEYFKASETEPPPEVPKNVPHHLRQFVRTYIDNAQRLVWIDCEMGGLDPNKHPLLEVSCVVTEANEGLDLIAEHETMVIHHSEETINSTFSDWCKENHAKSGLTQRVLSSNTSLEEAETLLSQFLQKFTRQRTFIAGNTVYMDKIFLERYMPKVDAQLHYRCVDVSSVSIMCKSLNRLVYDQKPQKLKSHRARTDIYESIQELRWYQKHFFKLLKK